jgi:hypothetical protein
MKGSCGRIFFRSVQPRRSVPGAYPDTFSKSVVRVVSFLVTAWVELPRDEWASASYPNVSVPLKEGVVVVLP